MCVGNHLPDVSRRNVISMQQCTIIAQLIPLSYLRDYSLELYDVRRIRRWLPPGTCYETMEMCHWEFSPEFPSPSVSLLICRLSHGISLTFLVSTFRVLKLLLLLLRQTMKLGMLQRVVCHRLMPRFHSSDVHPHNMLRK